ncbi:hypothetical protein ACWDBD_08835 [Streptomyces sp. NPDC001118]
MLCDDGCATALPQVVAVGDVARVGGSRAEHWTSATEQPRVAVTNRLAGRTLQRVRTVPYFWSDQHGSRIQFAGGTAPATPSVSPRARSPTTAPASPDSSPTTSEAAVPSPYSESTDPAPSCGPGANFSGPNGNRPYRPCCDGGSMTGNSPGDRRPATATGDG